MLSASSHRQSCFVQDSHLAARCCAVGQGHRGVEASALCNEVHVAALTRSACGGGEHDIVYKCICCQSWQVQWCMGGQLQLECSWCHRYLPDASHQCACYNLLPGTSTACCIEYAVNAASSAAAVIMGTDDTTSLATRYNNPRNTTIDTTQISACTASMRHGNS